MRSFMAVLVLLLVLVCTSHVEADKGYYDDGRGGWVCQDECIRVENGAVCGQTDHFRSAVEPGSHTMTWTDEKGQQVFAKALAPGTDSFPVLSVAHSISSPRDSASGLATGRRQHKPFVITTNVGTTTPQLYGLFVTAQNVAKIQIKQMASVSPRDTFNGKLQVVSTTTLIDAQIASIVRYGTTIEIALTYRTINWQYTNGGIEAADDWETRK